MVGLLEEESNRTFKRFSVRLSGRFLSGEQNTGWKECSILNISRKGMQITFPVSEKIPVGATVCIEIYIPKQLDPVNAKGTVKWIKQTEDTVITGVELCRALDQDLFNKLYTPSSM
jgi:hypothetical protein